MTSSKRKELEQQLKYWRERLDMFSDWAPIKIAEIEEVIARCS